MLSVVIPTFNERGNLTELVERAARTLKGEQFELIFIDDSIDDTPVELEGLSARYSFVRYRHRVKTTGLSSAVIDGFAIACGDVFAVMDGDLQHPPELLLPMYRCIQQGFDFCVTSRFIEGGDDGGLDIIRKVISWTARQLGRISISNVRKITDPTTGYFAVNRSILHDADIDPIGWKILIEMLSVCRYTTVAEIPMRFSERKCGSTKLSSRATIDYLGQLVGLHSRAVKNRVQVTRFSEDDIKVLACESPSEGCGL